MIKRFEEFKKDNLIKEEFTSPFIEKNKAKLREFFSKLKQEFDETKEAKNALLKYTRGEKPTEEEVALIRKQSMDILKGLGMGTIFMIPGGSLLLPFLLKMGHRVGIDLIPSAFKKNEEI